MTTPRRLAGRNQKTERDLASLYAEPSGLFHKLVRAAGLSRARDFRDRDLRAMYFTGADLSGFNFSGSDLRGTKLRSARRIDAATDFSSARLDPEDREWLSSWPDISPRTDEVSDPSIPTPPPEEDRPIRGEARDKVLRKLHELRSEHRDLDTVIERLAEVRATDSIHLQRLKKRKLMLKDEIAWFESRLIPD
jgi:hypothetical protein